MTEGAVKAPLSPLLSLGALLELQGPPSLTLSPQEQGLGGQTYTTARMGHSAEVLYHVFSLLTGMAPLKYSWQHSRPTLVARATETQTGAGVSVSVCVGGPGWLCGCEEGLWWVCACPCVCRCGIGVSPCLWGEGLCACLCLVGGLLWEGCECVSMWGLCEGPAHVSVSMCAHLCA